jgi:hypothetical protein
MIKTSVFKIVIQVIDFDCLGADEVKTEIENVRYANDCISPSVISIEAKTVEWSDDHPLNKSDTADAEFSRLFDDNTDRLAKLEALHAAVLQYKSTGDLSAVSVALENLGDE